MKHSLANSYRDNIERWLIHNSYPFEMIKNPENNFQFLIKHAGKAGNSIEIFEPKSQPGVIVLGSKVMMGNNQMSRYLKFDDVEKELFNKKVKNFCESIQAVNKIINEDGKLKIGVFIVLDNPETINHESIFEAIDKVSEMNEKTTIFLLKTF